MQLDTNPPSGTRDFLPDEASRRHAATAVVREVFEAYGFAGMDTPAFERVETLLGKYGEEGDQLIFRLLARGDKLTDALAEGAGEDGLADHALRYDLTVPLARYVAAYGGQLGEPFKRYAIAPVWRADRPGRGRYREFLQCDVDVVGADSPMADAEVLLAVVEVLDALGLDGFTVRLNARDALRGLIEAYGIPEELEGSALTAIDKLDKIGPDGVAAELRDRGVDGAAVDALATDLAGDRSEVTDRIATTERGAAGATLVTTLLELVEPNMAGGAIAWDPFLARGLSYYTGMVFEVAHDGLGASIAAGGRYDGLIGMFTNREIPATGGSLGMERILLLLEEQEQAVSSAPPVLVTVFDEALRADALALATRLRREGAIHADVYTAGGRMGKQLKYADRRGVRFALIRGSNEAEAGVVAVKELATGDQVDVPEQEVVTWLRERL